MKPNYKLFYESVMAFENAGLPVGNSDLRMLAGKYNTPLPNTKFWNDEFPEIDVSGHTFTTTVEEMENGGGKLFKRFFDKDK